MSFASFPTNLKRKKLIGIEQLGVTIGASNTGDVDISALSASPTKGTFDKNTLTYNNRPLDYEYPYGYYIRKRRLTASTGELFAVYSITYPSRSAPASSEFAKLVLSNSTLAIDLGYSLDNEGTVRLYGQNDDYTVLNLTPFIDVQYDDGDDLTSQITLKNTKSGYKNPAVAQTFSWDFLSADPVYTCVADFAQSSATFYWKASTEESYHQVNASGSTKSVTIAAGTFPGDSTIQYYVRGTDEDGTTTQTSVYTFNTTDASAIATVMSPTNTVEDGSAPITFRWNLANAYGNAPSLVNLWWKLPSEDNQSWHVIISSSTPITEYTVPGGSFPAGEIQWLVHAYNQDNVRGPDSISSFVCVAAPPDPSMIETDGVPYTTITWQCEGQQAYRIVIDDKDYGVRFGTEKSFTLDEPLSDGDHTVTITAQGVYGLWSQPGTAIFTVGNTAGNAITLTGVGGRDALLTWETEATAEDYYIYRDGVKIGHTKQKTYTDRLTLGTHNYYVINRLPNGNYTKSNSIALTLHTDSALIAAFPPSEWIDIQLSENSVQQQTFGYQKTMTTRHVYGAAYPVLENSSFEDMSGSYDTAFIEPEKASQFELLKGKAVCIKNRDGTVFVGAMATLQKISKEFFTAYTFTLTRIHWEDYADDTVG